MKTYYTLLQHNKVIKHSISLQTLFIGFDVDTIEELQEEMELSGYSIKVIKG